MGRLLFLLLVMLIPSHSLLGSELGDAPLLTRSESLGQLFRLNPPLQNPRILEAGVLRFDVSRTYANLWARDKRFVVDGEIVDDQSHVTLGLGHRVQLGLGFSSRRFAEADTDQTAISFHDLFRMGQDGRLETGKHHTRFAIPDYGLEYSRKNLDRSFSEQAVANLSYGLLSAVDWSWDVSVSLLAAYEMAEFSPYSSGSIDYGQILSARYSWQAWTFFGNARQLNFDQSRKVLVGTRAVNRGWALGTVYHLPENQQVVWQFMNNQPVFRDLGQLSRNSYEWQLGYRYHWEQLSLELAVIENIFWLYNSPDWGFSLGLNSLIP